MSESRRLCRQCKSPLGADDERCLVCGANNPVVLPWYTYPLGALIVAALVWLLVDFEDLAKVLGFR